MDNGAAKNKSIFETVKTLLSIIAAFLGVVGPLAYLMGISYHQGKLEEYGIDYSQFPLSISGAYVSAYSFIALIWMKPAIAILEFLRSILNPPGLWWFLIIITIWIILVWAVRVLSARRNKMNQVKININKVKIKEIFTITYWGLLPPYLLFAILTFFTFLWLVWVSPSYYAYLQGKDTAKQEINLFEKNGCAPASTNQLAWSKCTDIRDKDGKTLYEGLIVQMQNRKVAVFEINSNNIVIFELPDGYSMVRQPNSQTNP